MKDKEITEKIENLDLKMQVRISVDRGIRLMSLSEDWIKDHEKLQPYATHVASIGHRCNPNGYTKQQLITINGFFSTFCDRFPGLTPSIINSLMFTAQKMPTLPDFTKEDESLCQQTIDMCIQKLVTYKYHGLDKDFYRDLILYAMSLTKDSNIISQLDKKINRKMPAGYSKCLEPVDVHTFRRKTSKINHNLEYEG